MKQSSERPNRPPPFPPLPPPTNPPSSALPGIPSSQTTASRKSNGSPPIGPSASRHQRAQTLSAVPSSHISFSTPPSSPASTSARQIAQLIIDGSAPASPLAKNATEESSGKENFDMEKASADQLHQALALYLLKITEVHVAEQHALLKKVASLEQEATHGDVKCGFQVNERVEVGTYCRQTAVQGDAVIDTTSGAEESYRESGPEWGSGTSGGESSSEKRATRSRVGDDLAIFAQSQHQSQHQAVLAVVLWHLPVVLDIVALSHNPYTGDDQCHFAHRYSTSSLSLTTLIPATTSVTLLTAIPECPAPVPKSHDPVVAAAILATENQREKEERRASRASNCSSASSGTAPSASALYSANLKHTRPPSIVQVLVQSPKMEYGRHKLRSYDTSGSASS
ncbi:hypothetical protein B0H17DRAFT_1198945 [Mycena rosella]|uniref:Uncharacterized protein n=1 Tax=Mycena rosella TaxID=1033263 RepID=A0AAD7DPX5_MYCRO|nr:hypothetical protein B0H17DRAFT_1198945 [Mycena rosella]